jgi:cytochrome c-type biogenesis protein CcmH/NrfF
MHWNTLLLWFGPAFFVVIAALGFGSHLRQRATDQAAQPAAPLTTSEMERIDELLGKGSPT